MQQLGSSINPMAASLEFASELIVPGGSNLLKGDFVQAGVHFILGYAAKAAFGLPGLALVSANSITKALTGHHLTEHLGMTGYPPAPTIANAAQTKTASAGVKETEAQAVSNTQAAEPPAPSKPPVIRRKPTTKKAVSDARKKR